MDNNKKINDLIKKITLISEHEFNNKPLTQTDIYHFKKVLYKIESQTNEYNDSINELKIAVRELFENDLINEHKKRREENIKANKEINDYHRKLIKKKYPNKYNKLYKDL